VFQHFNLLSAKTVFENVALPLKARGLPQAEVIRRVDDTLALVGLGAMRDRGATQLSGGQQQRVAIARCVASRPRLMLLDEPLSNLDAKLRAEMRKELKDLQRLTSATMVFVTHDQEEAMSLADTIFLFRSGRIVQEGAPADIYRRPVDHYVAGFLGKANIFPVVLDAAGDTMEVRTADGQFVIAQGAMPAGESARPASCLVRPEYWHVCAGEQGLPGRIASSMFLGDRTEFTVETPIGLQIVTLPGYREEQPGDQLRLRTELAQMHLFAPGT
jgi:iron(III) transport system ATP-binding protein